MRTTISILCLAFLLTINAPAQTARFVGESLLITDGQRRVQLADVIEPHPITRCVHVVQKRLGSYFVIISASKWSRGYPPRGGRCGCGIESYIEWLHIRDGKIVERTMGLFESCFDSRGGKVTGWRGTTLTAETTDLIENREGPADAPARWRNIIFTFDAERPEEGIKEKEIERKTP